MAVQSPTIARRFKPVFREIDGAAIRKDSTRSVSRAAKLQDMEDRLIAKMLNADGDPRSDRALDRLLDDIERVRPERVHRHRGRLAHPRAALLHGRVGSVASRLHRIDDLLVAAVIDRHPNRDGALDRLLDDLSIDEERERAEFDRGYDNDFDGLG